MRSVLSGRITATYQVLHNWRMNWISRICFPPAFPNTRFCTITGCASGMWITVHSFLIVHLLTRQMFLKNGGRPISNWNDFSNRDLHVSLADSEEAQIGSWWRHELWMLNLCWWTWQKLQHARVVELNYIANWWHVTLSAKHTLEKVAKCAPDKRLSDGLFSQRKMLYSNKCNFQ